VMKSLLGLFLLVVTSVCLAQTPSYPRAGSVPAASPAGDVSGLLSRIEQEAQGLNADVGKLRIEKWKADSASKAQAAESAASIQRNISNALPELISAVRSAPQSLAANFKLYRNLNALYEVVASLGESAGAFGKKEEYELIGPHVGAIDDDRRSYADYLVRMTTSADSRIAAAEQAARVAAQQPPKKVIIDDNEPAPAPPKKKSKKKPASSSSSSSSSPK
jgi:hypothetical protein